MSKPSEQLKTKLKEIFQLDRGDLDFGIYRILNYKSEDIRRFLEDDLLPQVRSELECRMGEEERSYQAAIEKAAKGAKDAGVKPDDAPTIKKLRQERQELGGDINEVEREIYSHLYNFFRRYYKEGDFMSLRRYKEGVYALPYEGEEVKLHWANSDQYYIKSSESFGRYVFRVENEQRVVFETIVAETENDNNKNGNGKRFVLAAEGASAITAEGDTLLIRFHWKKIDDHRNQKAINDDLGEAILSAAPKNWQAALSALAPTDNEPKRHILAKHLNTFTAKNNFDYFIHKDLSGFLRRELDFFIKNEVVRLDDIESQNIREVNSWLGRLRAMRKVAHKIIDFLSQLENFQKRLWLKKKFILQSNYCVTLGFLAENGGEKLFEKIAANKKQLAEWQELYSLTFPKGKKELEVFFQEHPTLVIDTANFDESFKDTLLSLFPDIDDICDGLLIHGDNFQALNLMQKKYRERIKCIYIDPPYNTGPSEILYKNNYKHSSWLSLMENRYHLAKHLMNDKSVLISAIDENEQTNLNFLINKKFQDKENVCISVVHNPRGIQGAGFSYCHESVIFTFDKLYRLPLKHLDEEKEKPLMKTGTFSQRADGPNMFYPIYSKEGKIVRIGKAPKIEFHPVERETALPNGEVEIWPIDSNGNERKWRYSPDSVIDVIENLSARLGNTNLLSVYLSKNKEAYKTVWTESKYDAASGGSVLLKNMGIYDFQFPKSVYLIDDCLSIGLGEFDELVLDYFAGSGTTAHAVINLNREDGGRRKFILVEMGEYFDTVLLPRIKKIIYSPQWKDGKPKPDYTLSDNDIAHTPRLIKYQRIESYEDALDNLKKPELSTEQKTVLQEHPAAREDYMLRYMLDVETEDSASLLSLEQFNNPFLYTLNTTRDGKTQATVVDLAETFNYLIGLRLKTRARIKNVLMIEGVNPDGENILILWRDVEQVSAAELNQWFNKLVKPQDRREYGIIYVNGDNHLENLKREDETWKVRLIESEFHRLMFENE